MTPKASHNFTKTVLLPLIAGIIICGCSAKKDPTTLSMKKGFDSAVATSQSPVDIFKNLDYQVDTFYTAKDREIDIVFIRHASLAIDIDDYLVYIDPTCIFGDNYINMPKADMVLITNSDKSHCDQKALVAITDADTHVLGERQGCSTYPESIPLEAFQVCNVDSTYRNHGTPFKIYSVPAYITDNQPVIKNPNVRGGLGFILEIDDMKIYISGSSEFNMDMNQEYATEFIPVNHSHSKKEVYKPFEDIDIAFLAIDKATMSPHEAVIAAKSIRPEIVYPYHYSNTDLTPFFKELADTPNIETRRRRMGSIPTY